MKNPAKMSEVLLAGAARVDISPPVGILQGVWAVQKHQRSTGLDMPLYATALVLSQGETTVAIVDVDTIGFQSEEIEPLKREIESQTSIGREYVRICASHAHSGPNHYRKAVFDQGIDLLESYMDGLPKRIASAVWEAKSRLKAVTLGWDTGFCPIAVNRRAHFGREVVVGMDPDGPVDHAVRAIRFDCLEGKTVATLVHYACHPTILGWENKLVAPDYPGPTRREVERAVGGLCLFLQGAAGNVGPVEGYTGDVEVYRRLGRVLGLEAASVALRLSVPPRTTQITGIKDSGARIGIYSEQLDLPVPNLRIESRYVDLPLKTDFCDRSESEKEESESLQRLNDARRNGAGQDQVVRLQVEATRAWLAADAARRFGGNTHLTWQLQAIQIGPLALLGVPGEPFIEIALEVVQRSPFSLTLFSGYTNGGFGYLPVESAFAEGGYEVEASPFGPQAARIVIEESVALLQTLHSSSFPLETTGISQTSVYPE